MTRHLLEIFLRFCLFCALLWTLVMIMAWIQDAWKTFWPWMVEQARKAWTSIWGGS